MSPWRFHPSRLTDFDKFHASAKTWLAMSRIKRETNDGCTDVHGLIRQHIRDIYLKALSLNAVKFR